MTEQPKTASAQSIIPIKDIKEGVIIMKDGSYRSVISVASINLALKSEQEKDSIAYAYQGFLNSLEFPVQILSVSRQLDLTEYLNKVQGIVDQEQSPFIKIQAQEYHSFISSLLTQANIMDKEFFVVVTYYPGGVDPKKTGLFKKPDQAAIQTKFEEDRRALLMRVQQVETSVAGMGLKSKVLNSEEISDLLYILYNPDVVTNMRIGNAIESVEGAMVTGDFNNFQPGGAVPNATSQQ